MGRKAFVQRGRIALISGGRFGNKLCTIIDIIDQNRALVSGPTTGVKRQPMSFKMMKLTKFLMKDIHPTIGEKALAERWEKSDIVEQFAKSKTGMTLVNKKKKAKMGDFDRFKLYKTKQRINRLVKMQTARLTTLAKNAEKKAAK
ncbi:60S ribosomal protein L14-like [Panonychus citri]|uniref:60S ribosomal protein L14-like n=1 Tax=Panonychus citri TaxID=50023 RepID=UPI0023078495|nr:60S ribosomal protein L14-like [Panonychus citri]